MSTESWKLSLISTQTAHGVCTGGAVVKSGSQAGVRAGAPRIERRFSGHPGCDSPHIGKFTEGILPHQWLNTVLSALTQVCR